MAIITNLSTIVLNVNELNAPIRRLGWLNEQENKTLTYTAYKRITSHQKTHRD